MAIFRETNTTEARLKTMFKKKYVEPVFSRDYFKSLHPNPIANAIDIEAIAGMVKFIKDYLKLESYECKELYSFKMSGYNCEILYHVNGYKPLFMRILNVNSNYPTIDFGTRDEIIRNIESCPLQDWRKTIVKLILDCLVDIIDKYYKLEYRNGKNNSIF